MQRSNSLAWYTRPMTEIGRPVAASLMTLRSSEERGAVQGSRAAVSPWFAGRILLRGTPAATTPRWTVLGCVGEVAS